jgi:hypothetical protein
MQEQLVQFSPTAIDYVPPANSLPDVRVLPAYRVRHKLSETEMLSPR